MTSNHNRQLLYAAPILLGSFLLFQVQPILAKFILPWFGGTSAVWITALLFFQVLLLVGYGYAYASDRWLSAKQQAIAHTLLLVIACVTLPITPEKTGQINISANPAWQVLLILGVSTGLQYILLASTSPLLQAWLSRDLKQEPYRWYALSNAASLAGLLTFPFLVEPLLSGLLQTRAWSWLFIAYAVLSLLPTVKTFLNKTSDQKETTVVGTKPPSLKVVAVWIALSATGVILLLGITALLTQDVPSAPLLWILPLTLYLFSYILTFDSPQWYRPKAYAYIFLVSALLLAIIFKLGNDTSLLSLAGLCLTALFIGCMIAHGELAKRKPAPEFLTHFYLYIALGGALGGVFAGIIAPWAFPDLFEIHIGVLIVTGLAGGILLRGQIRDRRFWREGKFLPALGLVVIAVSFGLDIYHRITSPLYVHRNFYGVSRVLEKNGLQKYRTLVSGGTEHGRQLLGDSYENLPTLYYTPESGIGRLMLHYPEAQPLRVGVLGLGIGAMANYGDSNDYFQFYEINPDMRHIAENYFSYVSGSEAQINIALGDARLTLEQEQPQNFNVLIMDVFSSDAIPIHLLTAEAFDVYLKHLHAEGVLAVHISNRHVDLRPVLGSLAKQKSLYAVRIFNLEPSTYGSKSDWVLLSRKEENLTSLFTDSNKPEPLPEGTVWTDTYSNLLSVIRFPELSIHTIKVIQ